MATAPGSTSRIFQAEFRPDSDNHFVTVGVKHVKFWTIAGNQLIGKKGVMGHLDNSTAPPQMQTMLSIAFSSVSSVIEYNKASPTCTPFLKSYLNKVDTKSHPSLLRPLCNPHIHNTHHLFNCTHIITFWIYGHPTPERRHCWPDGRRSWLVDHKREDRTPPT